MLSVVISSGGIITFPQRQKKGKKDVINLPVNPLVHTSLVQKDHFSTLKEKVSLQSWFLQRHNFIYSFSTCWMSQELTQITQMAPVALVDIFSPVVLAFMKPSIKSSMSGLKTWFPCVQPHSVLCDFHSLYTPNPDFGLYPHEPPSQRYLSLRHL